MPEAAPLSAATYLGDNTVAMLDGLLTHVAVETGVQIVVDQRAGRDSADAAAHAGSLDLVWICGHLGRRLITSGALNARVIAAPVFAGEARAVYRSVIVGRRGWASELDAALAGCVGINEVESWSGNVALRRHVEIEAAGRWFDSERMTGSHAGSIAAVLDRTCDVAAIDSSIWASTESRQAELAADLVVIDQTRDWPAPPIAIAGHVSEGVRMTVTEAVLSFGTGAAVAGLAGFAPAAIADYAVMG